LGVLANFCVALAAIYDLKKSPELISGPMTTALVCYSAVFMRYSMAVTPKNYLLLACHVVNESAQLIQGGRYLSYWQFGGREKLLKSQPLEAVKEAAKKTEQKITDIAVTK